MRRASSRKLQAVATPPDTLARERIKRLVADAGFRQQAFGKRIGKGQVWVSRYLQGKVDADLDTLQRMAAVFGLSLDALLHEPDPRDTMRVRLYDVLLTTPVSLQKLVLDLLLMSARGVRK